MQQVWCQAYFNQRQYKRRTDTHVHGITGCIFVVFVIVHNFICSHMFSLYFAVLPERRNKPINISHTKTHLLLSSTIAAVTCRRRQYMPPNTAHSLQGNNSTPSTLNALRPYCRQLLLTKNRINHEARFNYTNFGDVNITQMCHVVLCNTETCLS